MWLDVQVPSKETRYEYIEMPNDATDDQCWEACNEYLQYMISDELNIGWDEIKEGDET